MNLEQLRASTQALSRISLAENLLTFPQELYAHADSLEFLDLSNNRLSSLPHDFWRFSKLRTLFMSNNAFTQCPEVLGQCQQLDILGLKSNQICELSSASLPSSLRWLILTDNQLEHLPEQIGQLRQLKKLMLAGNRLKVLPETLCQCANLQLLRLSANQLKEFPEVVLQLPQLAWLAFSGNPFCLKSEGEDHIPQVRRSELQLHEKLGQGASGVISRATWCNPKLGLANQVAIKVFKGQVTSDGYPLDELQACLWAGEHSNLAKPLAQIHDSEGSALVMELIPTTYRNLGLPPSLETCTRDIFPENFELSLDRIVHYHTQMLAVVEHLESLKIIHGDLYAHNILVNDAGHLLFGDFGAASFYANLSPFQQEQLRIIERRAFSHLLDDLLKVCREEDRQGELFAEK
jgi:hypothetical protein